MHDVGARDVGGPAAWSRLGRIFFGLGVMGSGVLQLAIGGFVRLVPVPAWVPAPRILAYLAGVVLGSLGLAIASGRMPRTAATVVAAMILAMLVVLHPSRFFDPDIDRPLLRGFMYTNPLKCLALVGGAALVARWWPDHMRGLAGLGIGRWAPAGPALLAAFLFVGGFQHFWYARFVDTLVPAWIPPSQRFWTLFAGVALMAGGIGMLVARTVRLAASLSGLMIFLWVVLLHIPRALQLPAHAFEAAGVFEALALSGVALLVAGTRSEPARAS